MTPDSNDRSGGTATDDFERALRRLVLESFACGADVQGAWDLTSASSLVPSWRVTIEKLDDVEGNPDEATFLDG